MSYIWKCALKCLEFILQVEKILSCRISTDGTLYYLIRWKGYGPEEDTWEPEENLLHCKDVIREFFDHGDDVPKSYISEVIHINEVGMTYVCRKP